ncbi:MAG TPA: hypothetical protein VM051_08995 [Usitatibacter sp.]|nr:hypothetical protein [Usitatibacter sp.]
MLRAASLLAATFAMNAVALESASWPPPGGVADRMRELQSIMGNPDTTAGQREAAREELSGLLKSPAGQSRRTPDEKPARAARAAIEPMGPIVKPAVNPHVAVPGVATVEVVVPPRIITVAPTTGAPIAPSGRSAVDPRTGNVLHDAGNGFVDPRTGQFTPR